MKFRTIAPVLLAVLLGTLSPAVAGPKDDLLATDRAFAAMSVNKGAHAAFLAYMSDDARVFEGDHPPIVGRKALEEYYAGHPSAPGEVLDWSPVEAEVSPDGVLGLTRGTWTLTEPAKDGKDVRLTGYYVTAWRRQADGKYRFVLDIGGVYKSRKD